MEHTIGIDLGTTNSAVAYHDGAKCEVIEVAAGSQLLPSVVAVDESNRITVGQQALRKLRAMKPEFVFSNIKSSIGEAFVEGEDYGPQIVNENGERWFLGPNDLVYSPEELSAEILKTLKAAAEKRLGKKIKSAVITVPAYFDNNRVDATQRAGEIAGFKNVKIETEPEMSALAYGIDKEKFGRVVVFDLGGGTFDIVLMEAGRGLIKVLESGGWDRLGGINFDREIQRWVFEQFEQDEGYDLNGAPFAGLRLAPVIEAAKKDLSDAPDADILANNVHYDVENGRDFDINYTLTREAFDELTAHLVDKAMEITKRTLDQANMKPSDFREVLMVGGMSRVPAVREAVEKMFGAGKIRHDGPNPDVAVAMGAAIKGALEDGRLVGTTINQAVAKAFGVEGTRGRFVPIIPKGSAYGTLRSAVLTNQLEGQDCVPIDILQGDTLVADECSVIGRYEHRIKPGAAHTCSIAIDFMIDENGKLLATGRDLDTGEELKILGG